MAEASPKVTTATAAAANKDEPVAANSEPVDTDYLFQCPIQALKIGKFQFRDGLLHIKGDKDLEEFESFIANVPAYTVSGIRSVQQVAVVQTLEQARANRKPTATREGLNADYAFQQAEALAAAHKANK